MEEKNKYLYYAKTAIDSTLDKFKPEELPPKGFLHYHQGVFLNGVLKYFEETEQEKYYEYIKAYIDVCVDGNGIISAFDALSFDDIQAGTLLFPLFEREKSIEKYKTALMTCMSVVKNGKRDTEGGFWHKQSLKNQMWLDGLYMVSQLQMMFAYRFGYTEFVENVYKQAFLMYERMKKENGLLYHAWSDDADAQFFDKSTKCSEEVWIRALGWYTLTLADIIELDKGNSDNKEKLSKILYEVLKAVIKYQDLSTGMWYQIVDKPYKEDNWIESSGSSMLVYSIAKAVRLGVLEDKFLEYAKRGYDGIIDNAVKIENGTFSLGLVCPGTSVGFYDGYVSRPKSCNDLHGLGPFIMMCIEMHKNCVDFQ